MEGMTVDKLAIPGVLTLICFLSYTSQYLFRSVEPGPLQGWDAIIFNVLVASLIVCYLRTCFTKPGKIPGNWLDMIDEGEGKAALAITRYCRRCNQPKPPRSHHCKTCRCCVPKMDHHCVWTANCISQLTFPHFVRFLSYAVAAMSQLEYFLYLRGAVIWRNRYLPSYLGPSVGQLVHLFILMITNTLTLFALSVLLGKTLWGLGANVTTIEGWEIERHQALVRRARVLGGSLPAPDGSQVRIEKQEFPWDIGILQNMAQGMGTWNVLAWLWPFSRTPRLQLLFQHNEIEDPAKPWPPPDPDRMFRQPQARPSGDTAIKPMDVESFRARQRLDQQRYSAEDYVVRRRPFHERYEHAAMNKEDDEVATYSSSEEDEEPTQARNHAAMDNEGEEAWRTREGERLADFGVDEDVEFYDEDDLPLSEIIRRKKL